MKRLNGVFNVLLGPQGVQNQLSIAKGHTHMILLNKGQYTRTTAPNLLWTVWYQTTSASCHHQPHLYSQCYSDVMAHIMVQLHRECNLAVHGLRELTWHKSNLSAVYCAMAQHVGSPANSIPPKGAQTRVSISNLQCYYSNFNLFNLMVHTNELLKFCSTKNVFAILTKNKQTKIPVIILID